MKGRGSLNRGKCDLTESVEDVERGVEYLLGFDRDDRLDFRRRIKW